MDTSRWHIGKHTRSPDRWTGAVARTGRLIGCGPFPHLGESPWVISGVNSFLTSEERSLNSPSSGAAVANQPGSPAALRLTLRLRRQISRHASVPSSTPVMSVCRPESSLRNILINTSSSSPTPKSSLSVPSAWLATEATSGELVACTLIQFVRYGRDMPHPTQREEPLFVNLRPVMLVGQVVVRHRFGDQRAVLERQRLPEQPRTLHRLDDQDPPSRTGAQGVQNMLEAL